MPGGGLLLQVLITLLLTIFALKITFISSLPRIQYLTVSPLFPVITIECL